MASFLKSVLVVTLICATVSTLPTYAQGRGESSSSASPSGPRKQIATILFVGIAGAIMGLSTLSFYGRPQDKLDNIAIGFAVGVIGGTVYTTYQAATRPREFYGSHSAEALDWKSREFLEAKKFEVESAPIKVGWTWDF